MSPRLKAGIVSTRKYESCFSLKQKSVCWVGGGVNFENVRERFLCFFFTFFTKMLGLEMFHICGHLFFFNFEIFTYTQ